MKKILKRIMFSLLLLVAVIVLAITIFFYTAPQIGGTPSGERLAKMESASNFKNGKFENQVLTEMKMHFGTIMNVMKHYLFDSKKGKEPEGEIKTQPFQADAFARVGADTVAFTWFGHSSLLVRINGKTILIDPVLEGKRASMFSFMGPERFDYDTHVGVVDLPHIDLVLISHDHYDHLDYPTIVALKEKVEAFYMPLGVGAHFESWGVPADKITELNWWDEVKVGELKLALTPTRHFSGRALRDRFNTLWGSWVIQGTKRKLYFSGDSGYFQGFKEIGEKFGPFDLTFMECGAYNKAWSEIHMFPEESAQAHLDVKGALMMPIHWGKFDLSLHPWKESVRRLKKKAEEENIQLVTPEVGQLVLIPDEMDFSDWWERYE
jgi:L-ascorbate metabolism protein UlaG (beta-lactamase superfamily)